MKSSDLTRYFWLVGWLGVLCALSLFRLYAAEKSPSEQTGGNTEEIQLSFKSTEDMKTLNGQASSLTPTAKDERGDSTLTKEKEPSPITTQTQLNMSEVLIQPQRLALGGTGGIGMKTCRIIGDNRLLATVHGDWIMFDQAFIGLDFFRMVSSPPRVLISNYSFGLTITGGGVESGYIYQFNKEIFLRGQMLLGIMSVFYLDPSIDQYTANDIMVIEPGIYAGLHLLDWLHVSLGATYRWGLGAEGREGFAADDFNSPAAEIRIEFGQY